MNEAGDYIKGWLQVREAAEIYGCNRSRLYRLIKQGRVETQRRYGTLLVNRIDLLKLRDENRRLRLERKQASDHRV